MKQEKVVLNQSVLSGVAVEVSIPWKTTLIVRVGLAFIRIGVWIAGFQLTDVVVEDID